MKFSSKIGIEFIVIVGLTFGLVLYQVFAEQFWLGVFISLIVGAFFIHLCVTTTYELSEENLSISSGFFYRTIIPLKNILRISESNDLISSPALSVDRLEIRYNKFDTVLISPKNKAAFLEAIVLKNKNIEIKYRNRKR